MGAITQRYPATSPWSGHTGAGKTWLFEALLEAQGRSAAAEASNGAPRFPIRPAGKASGHSLDAALRALTTENRHINLITRRLHRTWRAAA